VNVAFDPSLSSDKKFAVGQPVLRKEDPKLLRGEGQYTDDLNLPGQAYAVMVRSRHAHGRLLSIDTAAASSMPGVLGVFSQSDLTAAGLTQLPTGMQQRNRDGSPMRFPDQTPLATERVRYVGDPLAIVVAETAKQAKDAAEAVSVEVDPLPAVTSASAALAPGAPQIHETEPGNVALDFHHGDTERVAMAFAEAAHVSRLSIRNNRIVVCPIEPRSAVGEYDAAAERWVLRLGCQGVFGMRETLKGPLATPVERIRVLTGNVGGSFGMKSTVYPEYICVLHAARALSRPVKWTDERSESFLSDSHGRDHEMLIELALDAAGHFLAVRATGLGNIGAYLSNATAIPPTINTAKNLIGVYRTPLMEVNSRVVFTNTTPVGAYRGAGRPEGNYYMERIIDFCRCRNGHRQDRAAPPQSYSARCVPAPGPIGANV
jgi:carbon-monoxide dehydrogenase large subunit